MSFLRFQSLSRISVRSVSHSSLSSVSLISNGINNSSLLYSNVIHSTLSSTNNQQYYSSTSSLFIPSDAFRKASEQINALPSVDNTTKLKLYALYKQATVGTNTTSKPGMYLIGNHNSTKNWLKFLFLMNYSVRELSI